MRSFTSVASYTVVGIGELYLIEFEKPLRSDEVDLLNEFIELNGEIVKVTLVDTFLGDVNRNYKIAVRPPTTEEWMSDAELFEIACKEIEDIARNYENYTEGQEQVEQENNV